MYNPIYSRRRIQAGVLAEPVMPLARPPILSSDGSGLMFPGADVRSATRRPLPRKGRTEEIGMPQGPAHNNNPADCAPAATAWPRDDGRALWSALSDGSASAKERLGRLALAIEADVIPRLVELHRAVAPGVGRAVPAPDEVDRFVELVVDGSEAAIVESVDAMRRRGVLVESLYLELLAPVARRLGEMWVEDRCDFSTVTVGLGRLQRLLRELSPAFGTEVEHPPNGRRILLVQPDGEQHSFGLSMVAEFFRRAGWEVQGGIAGTGIDPVALTRREWYDVVGFSVGSEVRLDWVATRVAALRRASRNSGVVVIVGGPVFVMNPDWHLRVGADAVSADGGRAPELAEALLSARAKSEGCRTQAD